MLQNCYKKKLKRKEVSGSYQRNRTSSAKCHRLIPFFQIPSQKKSSDAFFTKIEDHKYVF